MIPQPPARSGRVHSNTNMLRAEMLVALNLLRRDLPHQVHQRRCQRTGREVEGQRQQAGVSNNLVFFQEANPVLLGENTNRFWQAPVNASRPRAPSRAWGNCRVPILQADFPLGMKVLSRMCGLGWAPSKPRWKATCFLGCFLGVWGTPLQPRCGCSNTSLEVPFWSGERPTREGFFDRSFSWEKKPTCW